MAGSAGVFAQTELVQGEIDHGAATLRWLRAKTMEDVRGCVGVRASGRKRETRVSVSRKK